jgi:hypothetical protein
MEVFGMASLFGLILGFMFGVGCAMAVLYSVYMGGYRKGIEDSFREEKSARYLDNLGKVRAKFDKELSGSVKS